MSVIWPLAAVLLVASAVANEPAYLYSCNKTTCEHKHIEGLSSLGTQVLEISAISDSETCPGKCTTVMFQGNMIHIVGHWLDVQCKAWGGPFCRWDDVILPKAKILELLQ